MKKLNFLIPLALLVLMMCIGDPSVAQVAGGGPPGPPAGGTPPCWPPPCIPIDGGLGFLLAAGALIGGKKLYDSKS
jgi:hypothetical protein